MPSDFEADAFVRVLRPSEKLDPGDRRNARQSLAPKAERRDGDEVACLVDLAGGVAQESQVGFVGGHAGSVVDDPDQLFARAFHLDADAGGACVDRVLDELLDDGRRPFDHFSRCDLVAHVFAEDANRRASSRSPPSPRRRAVPRG